MAAGLAQPVEVLHLVEHEEAVAARDVPALGPHAQQQPGERRDRQRAQRHPERAHVSLRSSRPRPTRGAGPRDLAADVAPRRRQLADHGDEHAQHRQPRALAVVPLDADLAQAEAERAGQRERLGVEHPAVELGAPVDRRGGVGAPQLEAAEEVGGRLAQHRAAQQDERAPDDPPPQRLAAADAGALGEARADDDVGARVDLGQQLRAARRTSSRSRRRSAAAGRRARPASRGARSSPCRGWPRCAAPGCARRRAAGRAGRRCRRGSRCRPRSAPTGAPSASSRSRICSAAPRIHGASL